MKQPSPNEHGFAGIEAAIIFIAFIVVASVFTYIMLGTGFFTTQVSQKVAHAGVEGASSNVVIIGDVLGLASDTSTGIDTIQFSAGLSTGGSPVDFRNSKMILSTDESLVTLKYNSGAAGPGEWNVSAVRNGNNNQVMSENQVWIIDVKPTGVIRPGQQFNLEIKPPGGLTLTIRRTVPRGLDPVNILY